MELYFFRHGIAEDREQWLGPDRDRPLTEEGMRKTRQAAEGLKRMEIPFDKILTSPYVRAAQTARILAEVLCLDSLEELEELSADREVDDLVPGILRKNKGERLLLVGHQPLMGETIAFLLSGSTNMEVDLKKAGICAVEAQIVPPRVPATLMWMLTPKQLRMLRP